MKFSRPLFILIPITIFGYGKTSGAIAQFADGLVTFRMTSSVEYDSRIRAAANSEEDTIFRINPTFQYSRPVRWADFSVSVGYSIIKYSNNDELDDDNFVFDLNFGPRTGLQRETDRFTFSTGINFSTNTRANEDVGDVVTTQDFNAFAGLTYRMNRRQTWNGRLSYSSSDPDLSGTFSTGAYSGSLRFSQVINAAFDGFADFNYRYNESDGNLVDGTQLYTLSAGISGQLLSKVTGSVAAGAQYRENSTIGSSSNPYFNANLSYAYSERISAQLSASIQQSNTIDDALTETRSISMSISKSLREDLNASLFTSFSETDYDEEEGTQKVERKSIGGSLNYDWNRYSNLALRLTYSDSSGNNQFDFDRWLVSLLYTLNF